MRTFSPTAVFLCLAAILALSDSSWAQQDSKYSRRSLKGLRGVAVIVEDTHRDAQRDGLRKRTIQTNTELLLRKHGIRVLDEGDRLREPGNPYLYVHVHTYLDRAGLYAYTINVELNQSVLLARDPRIKESAVTWRTGQLTGTVGRARLRGLYDAVDDQVKTFVNAYLSQNGKR